MPEQRTSPPPGDKKKKKTKLEKICELEGSIKILKEENRRLRQEINGLKSSKSSEDVSVISDGTDGFSLGGSTATGTGDEKLKDALRALKRVTMKQEMNLSKLRSKARQRRAEIETKDRMIEKLNGELGSLKATYQELRSGGSDDVSKLRTRLVDLELQLANEKACHEDQVKQLSQSRHDISSLQGQLEMAKDRAKRNPSSRSLQSETASVSSVSEDTAKLKRELANKIEKIANLEFELESAQDHIHEMKRNKQFDESFPATPAPGMEDLFTDDEGDEDDFWGN